MTSLMHTTRMLKKWAICLLLLVIFRFQGWAQIGPPPIITVQPLNTTVLKQNTAVFTVMAVSGTSLSYQWYLKNKQIKHATSSVLTIDDVGKNDAGSYKVTVKNASGTVTSSNATLVVVDTIKKNQKIAKVKMTANGFQLSLTNLTDPICVIYFSTNMVTWTPIATNVPSSGNVTFTDPKATNRPCGYYQAMTQ